MPAIKVEQYLPLSDTRSMTRRMITENRLCYSIGDYNREIVAHNRKVLDLKSLIAEIGKRIKAIIERMKQFHSQKSEPEEPFLTDYVRHFIEIQKQGRTSWSKAARYRAGSKDLKLLAGTFVWMKDHSVYTLLDFEHFIGQYQVQFDRLKDIGKENHRLKTALKHLENHEKLLPVFQQSRTGFFPKISAIHASQQSDAGRHSATEERKRSAFRGTGKDQCGAGR